VGVKRFLDRVWGWVCSLPIHGPTIKADKSASYTDSDKTSRALNKLIKKVTEDIEGFHFNTSVSAFMGFLNDVKDEQVSVESVKIFLKLLYPFAPHMTEELHLIMGGKKSLQLESWPKFDPKMVIDQTVEMVVQVNGKVKGKISIQFGADEKTVTGEGMSLPGVKIAVEGKDVKRVIFVQNRLINFVV
jgi:leucyl-tRNA synthetase